MMFSFTLFTWSMSMGIMFLNTVQTLERKIKYVRREELDGLSCLATDVIVDEDSMSTISCLTKCTDKGCETMFYNSVTRTCTGCARWYTSTNGPPTSAGTIAYRTSVPENVACASGVGSYGTSCYNWIHASSWQNAKTTCASVANRYLAVPDSVEENLAITLWLNDVKPTFGSAYLGITDEVDEGTWKNIHGETQSFFNWAENEPNDIYGTTNCVVMYSYTKWNDDSCDASNYIAVCEKNMALFER